MWLCGKPMMTMWQLIVQMACQLNYAKHKDACGIWGNSGAFRDFLGFLRDLAVFLLHLFLLRCPILQLPHVRRWPPPPSHLPLPSTSFIPSTFAEHLIHPSSSPNSLIVCQLAQPTFIATHLLTSSIASFVICSSIREAIHKLFIALIVDSSICSPIIHQPVCWFTDLFVDLFIFGGWFVCWFTWFAS